MDPFLKINETTLLVDGPGERRYLLDLSAYQPANGTNDSNDTKSLPNVWVELFVNGSDASLSDVDGNGAYFDYVNVTGHQNVLLIKNQWVVFKTHAISPLEIFFQVMQLLTSKK